VKTGFLASILISLLVAGVFGGSHIRFIRAFSVVSGVSDSIESFPIDTSGLAGSAAGWVWGQVFNLWLGNFCAINFKQRTSRITPFFFLLSWELLVSLRLSA
jgi:hypothetical protein